MAIRIVTADERLSEAANGTSLAIFGPTGVGKTSLLRALDPNKAFAVDLEAGMKSVQDWHGVSSPVRTYTDFRDLCVLIAGPDPSVAPSTAFSQAHYDYVVGQYQTSGLIEMLAQRPIIFVDSITDLTRQVMTFAKQQPEAFSEKTGKPDTRGAYGLLGREVIQSLKHLQHARGKTVIFVGILEKVTDEMHVTTWQPQMEGGKAGRELPGLVDQVVTMHYFDQADDGSWTFNPDTGKHRRLVCQSANAFSLPAKDRSGRLDETEAADLGALLAKINGKPAGARGANQTPAALHVAA